MKMRYLALCAIATGMIGMASCKSDKSAGQATDTVMDVQDEYIAEAPVTADSIFARYKANNEVADDSVYTTSTGLKYMVLKKGEGKSPKATDSVKVHYTGTLPNGSVFDSSVERGEPITFPLNGVIPGWTEGLQLMQEGGKTVFYIPSNLAYGSRGAGPMIGPDQDLVFEVELIEVNPAAE